MSLINSKVIAKAELKKSVLKKPKEFLNLGSLGPEKMVKKSAKFADQDVLTPSNKKTNQLSSKTTKKKSPPQIKVGKSFEKPSRLLSSLTPIIKTRNIEIVTSAEMAKMAEAEEEKNIKLEDFKDELQDLSKKVAILTQSNLRKNKEERELRSLEMLNREMVTCLAVKDKRLYRNVLKPKENFPENNDLSIRDYQSGRRYFENEERAGQVLHVRIEGSQNDDQFLSKKKEKKLETIGPVKSKIRNIEIKQFGENSNNEISTNGNEESSVARLGIDSDNNTGFLLRMKMRQEERNRKRNEIRRFHQVRAEESRLQRAEEAALRVRLDQEERERKREERKLLKKKIKEREKLKEDERERQQLFNQIAIKSERISLMKRFFKLWDHLISNRRLKELIAEKHHEKNLKRKCLYNWHGLQQSEEVKTMSQAEAYFERRIMSRHFYRWMEQTLKSVKKTQASSDFRDFKLTLHSFSKWQKLAHQSSQREWKLTRKADKFLLQHIMRQAWSLWRKAVSDKDTLLAMEIMRKRLHDKVTLEVSDYIPYRLREV